MNKLFTFIFALILLPNLLFAAWWNPFSWFKNDNQQIDEEVLKIPSIETTDEFLEQEIIKNISVENPELQKQINTLISENKRLINKINNLEKEIASCHTGDNSKKNTNITSITKNPINEEGYIQTKSYTEENYTSESDHLFKRLNQLRFEIPDLKEKFEDNNCKELVSRNQNIISPNLLKCKDMKEQIEDLEDEEREILEDIGFLKSKYGIR